MVRGRGAKKAVSGSQSTEAGRTRIAWTFEMHEVFYEEAAARQTAINKALSRNSSSMTTNQAKWKPLLYAVNERFAAMGAPELAFDQLMQKINNTKKLAKQAWNQARYAQKTGAPTTLEEYKGAVDQTVALHVMPTFLKFLDYFWDVPEWAVLAHSDCTLDDKDADVDQGSGSDDGVGSDSGNADAALEEGGDQRQRRVPKPRRHDPDELAPGDVFFDTSPETEPRQKRASKKEQEAAAVLAGLSSYSNPLNSGSSDDNDLASDDVSTGTSPVKGGKQSGGRGRKKGQQEQHTVGKGGRAAGSTGGGAGTSQGGAAPIKRGSQVKTPSRKAATSAGAAATQSGTGVKGRPTHTAISMGEKLAEIQQAQAAADEDRELKRMKFDAEQQRLNREHAAEQQRLNREHSARLQQQACSEAHQRNMQFMQFMAALQGHPAAAAAAASAAAAGTHQNPGATQPDAAADEGVQGM